MGQTREHADCIINSARLAPSQVRVPTQLLSVDYNCRLKFLQCSTIFSRQDRPYTGLWHQLKEISMVTDSKMLSAPRAYSNQTETPAEKIENTVKKALDASSNDVAATPTVSPSAQSSAKATEEPVRATGDVAQQGREKLNPIAQVPYVVAFGYPSIVFKLVEYTQQTVQRNVTVLSQML